MMVTGAQCADPWLWPRRMRNVRVRRVEAATWWLVNRSHAAHIHPRPWIKLMYVVSLLVFPVPFYVSIFTESNWKTGRFQGPSHLCRCAVRRCGGGCLWVDNMAKATFAPIVGNCCAVVVIGVITVIEVWHFVTLIQHRYLLHKYS